MWQGCVAVEVMRTPPQCDHQWHHRLAGEDMSPANSCAPWRPYLGPWPTLCDCVSSALCRMRFLLSKWCSYNLFRSILILLSFDVPVFWWYKQGSTKHSSLLLPQPRTVPNINNAVRICMLMNQLIMQLMQELNKIKNKKTHYIVILPLTDIETWHATDAHRNAPTSCGLSLRMFILKQASGMCGNELL